MFFSLSLSPLFPQIPTNVQPPDATARVTWPDSTPTIEGKGTAQFPLYGCYWLAQHLISYVFCFPTVYLDAPGRIKSRRKVSRNEPVAESSDLRAPIPNYLPPISQRFPFCLFENPHKKVSIVYCYYYYRDFFINVLKGVERKRNGMCVRSSSPTNFWMTRGWVPRHTRERLSVF